MVLIKFEKIELNTWNIFLILVFIGILRTLLEFYIGITYQDKWWSLDLDVFFVMIFFVPHFVFFGSMILDNILKLFNHKIYFGRIILFLFLIQLVHLLIPLFDKIGFILNIPYIFRILPFENSEFFLSWTVMTFGIMLAWLFSGVMLILFLIKSKLTLFKSILISFILFNFFYWPTYHFYFTFNGLFDLITNNYFSKGNVWGYGIYFMLATILGLVYNNRQKFKGINLFNRHDEKRQKK